MELHYHFFESIEDIVEPAEYVGRNNHYVNLPVTFDIESTSFYENGQKRGIMYAWVFGINGKCIRGRTWDEFFKVLEYIAFYYNTDDKNRAIIWVQNLSFEFQFLMRHLKWKKVFSLDNRKPCYAITENGIEFRCSYILSGYSLETMGKNLLKYKVQKRVGDLDYNLVRHSSTPLTENEWGYILNDGLVVMAYIQEEIEKLGDISQIPLTKTGYVRKRCSKYCFSYAYKYQHNELMRRLTLTPLTYARMKKAYSGGFTHANINYVDKVIKNVASYDFTSSYPAVMLSEKYPMSNPIPYEPKSYSQFKAMLDKFCCMFECTFTDLASKVEYENYISSSKCYNVEDIMLNNGRVCYAKQLSVYITEQDFKIIEQLYSWTDVKISKFMYFYKEYLPKPIVEMILDLYEDKTTLKGVQGKEIEYLSSKADINSLYGMCVTDMCRDEFIYDNDKGWQTTNADIEECLLKYNMKNTRTLYYAWGVWVTAYARANLFSGIIECANDYVYSDTDSIKIVNAQDHQDYFDKYNIEIVKKINACLRKYGLSTSKVKPKTIKGVEKPLGVWDYEGTYNRFKTLGAKRYITETDGEISITIAGVGKVSGVEYLKSTYKTTKEIFKAFTEDLCFPASYMDDGVEKNGSGKLCHTYLDYEQQGIVRDYLGNYGEYHELSSVHLEPTEYNMSLNAEFKKLLLGIKGDYIV